MIKDNLFREDLYYRLKVVDLHLSPLRERQEDIPELVGFFVRLNNAQQGKNIRDVTPRAMEALVAYRWPGNIRELSNSIERALLFCDGETIDLPDLPDLEFNQPTVSADKTALACFLHHSLLRVNNYQEAKCIPWASINSL